MHKRIKKYILTLLGLFFVALGIIGAVLPVLPTTPFLLLALACFANSSPRFHHKLLNNRWFGTALQQWGANRSITRSTKVKAMLMIVVTFAVSIGVLHGRLPLQLGLLTLGSILLVFIWRLKEDQAVTVPVND